MVVGLIGVVLVGMRFLRLFVLRGVLQHDGSADDNANGDIIIDADEDVARHDALVVAAPPEPRFAGGRRIILLSIISSMVSVFSFRKDDNYYNLGWFENCNGAINDATE